MEVIVTGGAGFVGSHLTEFLISKGHYPVIVDNLTSGKFDYIKKFVKDGKAEFFNIDIRNLNHLEQLPRCPAVIHLAAIPSVIESIRNPTLVNDVNVTGTLNMLEFCRERKIRTFIFASSAAVFGSYEGKISEISPATPNTVYGATKLVGEHYCRIYSELFRINVVILRPFNIYGPRQKDSYAGVISKFIARIKENRAPIIFGDGEQTRDFIHVMDVAKAFAAAINYAKKNKFDYFNLATGRSITINYLAQVCLKLTGRQKLKPIYKKAIPGVIVRSSADIHKISKLLDFDPSVRLEDGLRPLLDHSLNNINDL